MDGVTRCLQCGKRTVPVPVANARTELKCIFCDLDLPKTEWAESPARQITPTALPDTAHRFIRHQN
jgi:hypothetical protein